MGALFYPADHHPRLKRLARATWVPEYGHAKGAYQPSIYMKTSRPLTFCYGRHVQYRQFRGMQGFADFIRKAAAYSGAKNLPWFAIQPCLGLFTYLLGHNRTLPAYKGAELTQEGGQHPVLVLSHGGGGNRMVQSLLCLELASQVNFYLL